MRPAGEVSIALLQAVKDLSTPERAPVLKELAAHINSPEHVVKQTLKDMKRYERLSIARKRSVPWCTRPVAEWCLPSVGKDAANDDVVDSGFAILARAWG